MPPSIDNITPTTRLTSNPQVYLPPPPEAEYSSHNEALQAIYKHVAEHGYDLVKKQHKKNVNGVLYKYSLLCARHVTPRKPHIHNHPKSQELRLRDKASRGEGCKMKVILAACDPQEPSKSWEVRHSGHEAIHTHQAEPLISLAGVRKRSRQQDHVQRLITSSLSRGYKTRQILRDLKDHPGVIITRQDLWNERMKYRLNQSQDSTQTEQSPSVTSSQLSRERQISPRSRSSSPQQPSQRPIQPMPDPGLQAQLNLLTQKVSKLQQDMENIINAQFHAGTYAPVQYIPAHAHAHAHVQAQAPAPPPQAAPIYMAPHYFQYTTPGYNIQRPQ